MTAIVTRGNALDLHLPDASVDLVVTSPPYFGLRSYQDGGSHYEGQVGDEATPTEYLDALVAATREWVRVLKPGGSIFVNLGDKYAGAPSGPRTPMGDGYIRDAEVEFTGPRRRKRHDVPTKSLIGLPWRYAIRCIDELGLILRAEIVWAKPNGLPESVTDRVRRSHEQVFHFVKQPRYFSAVDEVREAHQATAQGRNTTGWKPGPSGNREIGRGAWDDATVRDFATNPLGKLPGSVWTIPTAPLAVPDHLGVDHFAAYPPELVRRIVLGWSPREVCTACGEGRRPVTETQYGRIDTAPLRARAHRSVAGHHRMGSSTLDRHDIAAAITGYTCGCVDRVHRMSDGLPLCGAMSDVMDTDARYATCDRCRLIAEGIPTGRPGVVLDPFGGTGTTALVASAYGRVGISVDLSADYCRLAQWRTTDPGERARVLGVDKPPVQVDGQLVLFEGGAA